ncbi:MAG: hypothetical protein HOK61_02615 [Alphaproteobacteria bacterium]|nr:hypothetical protein [Alphaproteobacteria bacterium]
MNRTPPLKLLAGALLAGSLAATASTAFALEIDPNVPPEISLGGRLVGTTNLTSKDRPVGGEQTNTELDIADTSVSIGLAKYLFRTGGYAFGNFGLVLPEDDSDLEDNLFVHEVRIGVGHKDWEISLGRSRLPNTLVTFPTIRDDDLLAFTHVGNGNANVEAEEDQIYGGVVQGNLWFTPEWRVMGAATARAETDLANLGSTERTSRSDLNGLAAGVFWEMPESIRFDRGLRFAGLSLDWQQADRVGGGEEEDISAIIGGAVINLSDDPEASWSIDLQGIYNLGSSVPSLDANVSRARAEQYAVVGALRYIDRPYLQTNWQAALTVGWRDYADISSASAFAITPSVAWRIGSGINVVGQYRYLDQDIALAAAENNSASHTLLAGLTFSLDTTFNESVGERNSILTMEHDMLDVGPVNRGH